jgi:hypothetical protein
MPSMLFAVASASSAWFPLALIPSLGEWIVIGIFGSLLFSRFMKKGQAVRAILKEQPRTRESTLDRVRQKQVPISIGMAAICLVIAFDMLKEGRYGQGTMLLLCAMAGGMLAFALHQR